MVEPPVCGVCNDRFAPGDGALITFQPTDEGRAFAARQSADGIVGHPPDDGWFCGEHAEQAGELSSTLALGDALGEMRGVAVRRWVQRFEHEKPVCLSCDEPFVTETGGRAVFRVDAAGHLWNAGLRDGSHDGNGPRPYHGWFCSRHLGPAQLVGDALTRSEAMPLLVPEGRPPLEYRQHPLGVDISLHADQSGEPLRAPFVAVADGFEPTVSTMCDIAPRVEREAHQLLQAALSPIAVALGADQLRNFGTNSVGATSYSSSQSGEISAFVLMSGEVGIVIQRREETLLEVTVSPATEPTMSGDGQLLFERLAVSALSSDVIDLIEVPLADLVEALTLDAPDPFDLAPDLVDVDLCGAVLVRGARSGTSSLQWDIAGLDVDDVFTRLVDMAPACASVVGIESFPELTITTERTWNPMDGAVAPSCPYTDTRRAASEASGDVTVLVEETRTHWNEHDIANVSASLSVRLGDGLLRLSASGRGSGRLCRQLSMPRPVEAVVIDIVARAFDLSSGDLSSG